MVDLVSVNMDSWDNDISAYMVVAYDIHHGSFELLSIAAPCLGWIWE